MHRSLRSAICFTLFAASLSASGQKWTQPTPDELKMTTDPAAPGVSAVFLYIEQTADDYKHESTLYARIKILTSAGVDQFSDVTLPYMKHFDKIRAIEARTIHSDGTVIPFTGKPWQKEVAKARGIRVMEKGFSLPDVQIGSILEYRYMVTYDDYLLPPEWYLQHSVPVREAHYRFVPAPGYVALATRILPPNAQETMKGQKVWELHATNIPPLVDEDDEPPIHSLGYRVLFYYGEDITKPADYWLAAGRGWSNSVDRYVVPDQLKTALAQIVAPGDTDDQKLHKIYAAVMQLDNTYFDTRELTDEENKANKPKDASAADIWQQRRGNRQEIALLFIGLVRAAGLPAYAMRVVNRDESLFSESRLDWDQLDDTIAIVPVDGINTYFDPGDRYCEYGKLAWKHTIASGIRQTEKDGPVIATTPFPAWADNDTTRHADLQLDADGQIHGTITFTMTGNVALAWRQQALVTDEDQAKKDFRDSVQSLLPQGVMAAMSGFTGLTDATVPLTARLEVSGTMGTTTGKRLFLPGAFFEAKARPRFSSTTRVNPVYLPYAYTVEDHVKLALPEGMTVDNLPKDAQMSFATNATYGATYRAGAAAYEVDRQEQVSRILYKVDMYPDLRDFFQKVSTQDQEQVVLKIPPSLAVGGR